MNSEQDSLVERLQSEYHLKVLKLSIDRSGPAPQVIFELSSGLTGSDASQPCAVLTADVEAIGLRAGASAYDIAESHFALPDYLTLAIKSALNSAEPADAPLWLRFASPIGILPIAPWERLLQPVLCVPVLRLPYHAILHPPDRNSLDSVVCFSSPKAKAEISASTIAEQFLRQIPADLAAYTTFHLFADEQVQPLLHGIQGEFGDKYDIHVYDPKQAPTPLSERSESRAPRRAGDLTNPWLIWMRDSLADRSADLVHFLCHCYLNGEDGALALAESPVMNADNAQASFIYAAELAEFLNQTGAWSVAFTSPPGNHSVTGMRMLQDQVARLRPGPCMLHDMVQPQAGEGLGQAYRFLYVQGWQPPPDNAAISLYCHPYHAKEDVQADASSESLLNEYTLSGRLGDLFKATKAPAWISTAQRVLEQNVGNFSTNFMSEKDAAVGEGQRNATRFVADLLAKHARVEEQKEKTPARSGKGIA